MRLGEDGPVGLVSCKGAVKCEGVREVSVVINRCLLVFVCALF